MNSDWLWVLGGFVLISLVEHWKLSKVLRAFKDLTAVYLDALSAEKFDRGGDGLGAREMPGPEVDAEIDWDGDHDDGEDGDEHT